MVKNLPGLKRGFHYDPIAQDLGIYVNGVQVQSYSETAGRTYYVNNITGSSSGSGRSWGDAFDQISTAITAVVAYQDTMASGNEYVRNRIVIQGTSTAYTNLTSLAGYTDYIGIGADPSGNGGGIARIAAAVTATDAIDTGDDAVRGVNMYNLQCTQPASGASYGLDIATGMYRSRIEHCGFTNNTTAGIHIKSAGSLVIDDCHTMQDQYNSTYGLLIGSTSAATGNFNNCKVTNSYFHGTTAGCQNYNNSCNDTWIHQCAFIGGTYGFAELSSSASSDAHYLRCSQCYGHGTANTTLGTSGFVVTTDPGKRFFNCYESAQTVSFQYPSTDMQSD